MILKLALRNILRQKRRSFFTITTIVAGFVFASMAIGWRMGSFNLIIDKFTRAYLGHIQIHAEGYLDRPTLYKVIEDYEAVGKKLDELDCVEAWAPRLYAAGLASVGEKSDAIRIIGIDPVLEEHATAFKAKIEKGKTFSGRSSQEVILGKDLADALAAKVGDELVVVVQAADGSIGNELYRIVGSISTGNGNMDRMAVYMPLSKAQELMVMPNLVHEIAIITPDIRKLDRHVRTIREKLAGMGLEVLPWYKINVNMFNMIKAKEDAQNIMQFVIMLIVAVGILNSVLMSVLERTREFGVLKAIGTRPSGILKLIITETLLMSSIGIVVGAVIGTGINYALSIHGIKLSNAYEIGGIMMDTLKSEVNATTIVDPAILVFFTALVVSLYPAFKAARTDPAKAMRFH